MLGIFWLEDVNQWSVWLWGILWTARIIWISQIIPENSSCTSVKMVELSNMLFSHLLWPPSINIHVTETTNCLPLSMSSGPFIFFIWINTWMPRRDNKDCITQSPLQTVMFCDKVLAKEVSENEVYKFRSGRRVLSPSFASVLFAEM